MACQQKTNGDQLYKSKNMIWESREPLKEFLLSGVWLGKVPEQMKGVTIRHAGNYIHRRDGFQTALPFMPVEEFNNVCDFRLLGLDGFVTVNR